MLLNFPKHTTVLSNKTNSYVGFHQQSLKKNNLTLNEKFINLLMKNGNKLKANRIFYDSLKILYFKSLNSLLKNKTFVNEPASLGKKQFNYSTADSTGMDLSCNAHKDLYKDNRKIHDNFILVNANKLFTKAVDNVKPSVETRNVRVSGRTYPVPAVIGKHRQQILAIRWLIECATKNKRNSSVSFSECLAIELYEAANTYGKAKQKRDAMHKHAESNRAYIRFKWW